MRKSEPRKAAVPKATDVNRLAPRTKKNFLSDNWKEAEATPKRSQPKAAAGGDKALHDDFGAVPDYLRKRQAEWEKKEAERVAQTPDKDCPPGMSLMPEDERKETLAVLLKSQDAAKDQLRRMPLVIETQGQVRRKNDLDAKLKEIEDAIVIFSRDKVYVKD